MIPLSAAYIMDIIQNGPQADPKARPTNRLGIIGWLRLTDPVLRVRETSRGLMIRL